jgi:hypothetical protein
VDSRQATTQRTLAKVAVLTLECMVAVAAVVHNLRHSRKILVVAVPVMVQQAAQLQPQEPLTKVVVAVAATCLHLTALPVVLAA